MSTSITSNASDSELKVGGVSAVKFNTGGSERHIESLTCTQAGGALTFTLNPTVLDFRSATLTDGTTAPVLFNSPVAMTLSNGSTLGFPTTVAGSIVVLALSTGDIAVGALAGGMDLSEQGIINTTAEGGAGAADSATVFYSTTARTGVAYRVVGIVTAVNTAGAWGDPTLVQGAGGNALTAMSSLGYGQTRTSYNSGTRAYGTTYYNTGAKPREVNARFDQTAGGNAEFRVNGTNYQTLAGGVAGYPNFVSRVIQPGESYGVFTTGSALTWLYWNEMS